MNKLEKYVQIILPELIRKRDELDYRDELQIKNISKQAIEISKIVIKEVNKELGPYYLD